MSLKKILIVDDDYYILEMLELLFTGEGFEVQTSIDGQALQTLAESQPDLILLDVHMPQLDGVEVSRSLKADPNTGHIPIILFSAHFQFSITNVSHVNAFIRKPFEITELLELVEKVRLRRS